MLDTSRFLDKELDFVQKCVFKMIVKIYKDAEQKSPFDLINNSDYVKIYNDYKETNDSLITYRIRNTTFSHDCKIKVRMTRLGQYDFLSYWNLNDGFLKNIEALNQITIEELRSEYFNCYINAQEKLLYQFILNYHQNKNAPIEHVLQLSSKSRRLSSFNFLFYLFQKNMNCICKASDANKTISYFAEILNNLFDINMQVGKKSLKQIEINNKYDLLFLRFYISDMKDHMTMLELLDVLSEKGKAYFLVPKGMMVNKSTEEFRNQLKINKWLEAIIDFGNFFTDDIKTSYVLLILSRNNENFNVLNFEMKNDRIEIDYDKSKSKTFNDLDSLYDKSLTEGLQIGEYCDVIRGFQKTKAKEEVDEGFWFNEIRIKDMSDDHILYEKLEKVNLPRLADKFVLKKNDIILTTKGANIDVAFISEYLENPTVVSPNLTILRVKNEEYGLNPYYLYSYLKSEKGKEQLYSLQTGSSVQSIPVKSLENFKIPKISLEKQKEYMEEYIKLEELKNIYLKRLKEVNDNQSKLLEEYLKYNIS